MKLSEVPEGVWVECTAYHGLNTVVKHVNGMTVFKNGNLSETDPSLWTVNSDPILDELATLRTRIAELESKLAKATRPAPAVGQVWRSKDGKQFVVMRDYENVGGFVVASETLDAIPNMKDPLMAGDTYVGIWDGKFNVVKESAE